MGGCPDQYCANRGETPSGQKRVALSPGHRGGEDAGLDEKDRLLFARAERGDRTYLLVLEVVRNHDYAKARFLNGGACTEADFVPVAAPGDEGPAARRLKYVNPASPAFHLLDKPLSFDLAQTEVFEAPLPLIVIGSAAAARRRSPLRRSRRCPGTAST